MNFCCSQFSYDWSEGDVLEGVVGEGMNVGKINRELIQEEMAVSEKASSVEEETSIEESEEAKIDATKEVVKTTGDAVSYLDVKKSDEMPLPTGDDDLEDVEETMEVSETESSSDDSDIVFEDEKDLAELATCGVIVDF